MSCPIIKHNYWDFGGYAICGYSPFNFCVEKNLPYLLCSPDTSSIFVGRFLMLASIGYYSL